MNNQYTVSPSPHIRGKATSSSIMRDVVIALIPTLLMSIYIFGLSAFYVTAVCIISSVGFEFLYNKLMKQGQTIKDFSAVITGTLLAFNLPATLPLWMAVIGSFVAIVLVKCLFGGLGKNFANPAIVGRLVLFVSFANQMLTYPNPFYYQEGVDAVASATPLQVMGTAFTEGKLSDTYLPFDNIELLLGFQGGVIGETCALTLILGGIYLVYKKVISPIVPLTFIGTVFVLSMFFYTLQDVSMNGFALENIFTMSIFEMPTYQILSGGLMLGAIFMATDYATSPLSKKGKFIFGLGCGFITVVIRLYGSYPEGVSFAILLMNILSPYIDKYTRQTTFGGKR